MSAPVYDAPEHPATAQARTVASWLLGEAKARRLDPIESAVAEFETVHLTVRPANWSVWMTWCNLLRVSSVWLDTGALFDTDDDSVNGRGTWDGVSVLLTGLNPADWATP